MATTGIDVAPSQGPLMSKPADAPTRLEGELAARLRALWERGQAPDVDVLLAQAGPVAPSELLRALCTDLEQRWRVGQRVKAEEYLGRYPVLGDDPEKAIALIVAEYQCEAALCGQPCLEDFLLRFPQWRDRLLRHLAPSAQSGERTEPGLDRPSNTSATLAPPSLPPPIGHPNLPGYDVLRELGRGGMGVVYEAFDRRRGSKVALKTMQGVDSAALLRFKQEFRVLAGLAHPNLVTLYELVGDGPQWFFTMELVQGISFLDHLRRAGPQRRLARLRDALRQLVDGLHFLHRSGRVHRDVKPGNVLVTAQGRVVLLDFGLAAELDRSHQHHSFHLLGTAAYMAPEQAACRAVSPAADWYAVGVMLYEALTSQLPFEGNTAEVLFAKQERDPCPPEQIAPEVPADLGELCMGLLRRDPSQRPCGDVLLARLGATHEDAAPVALPAPSPEVPLIGRSEHLSRLGRALEVLRSGRPSTMFVRGRSGAGKSALLQCFLDSATQRGEVVVLAGRCYEQESVPYKALDSLVDELGRYLDRLPRAEVDALLPRDIDALARVFPVLRSLGTGTASRRRGQATGDLQEMRRRGLAALRELLARLGDREPLVLAIDDLQWGDLDSAALLAALLRPPDPPLLLLVACYRSEDEGVSPCLRALHEALAQSPGPDCRTLDVEPLTPEERRELARALLAQGPTSEVDLQAEVVADQSGGYPFFVHELVQYLRAGRPLGTTEHAGARLSLREVLWERICHLKEDEKRLLEVVAVAGRPVRLEDLYQAARLEGDRTALVSLRSARLLRSLGPGDQDEVETYHDRVRETVLAHLSDTTLRTHHRRLAEVLQTAARADPEVLAFHWQRAGEPERAGSHYAQAADQAAEALAFDRAAKLYGLVLELAPGDAGNRRRLATRLGDALANAGRGAEAARAYLMAADGAEEAERLDLQRRAALQFLCSGHVDQGMDVLRVVLAAVGLTMPRTPGRAVFGLLWHRLLLRLRGLRFRPRRTDEVPGRDLLRVHACETVTVGLSMVDTIQGSYFQVRALRFALRAGQVWHIARGLAMEAAHQSIGGSRNRPRTTRLLRRAAELAAQTGDRYLQGMASLATGIADALAGEWKTAAEGCDRAQALFRESRTGVTWELGTAYRFGLWPRVFMGQVREIARRLPALIEEATARDDLYTVTNLTLTVSTLVRMAEDEPGRAREDLAQCMERWSQKGFHVQHMNRLHDEVQLDLYEADHANAGRRLAEGWQRIRASGLLYVQQVRVFLNDLWARCQLADAQQGTGFEGRLRGASRTARRLAREGAAWAKALARLLNAGVARARGRYVEAARLYDEAAKLLESTDMMLHAAAAHRRRGELIGGDEGRALVEKANTIMAAQQVKRCDRLTALLAPVGSTS